ncbi:sigma-54-dependent Fis family transcriptional regulator [Pelobacter sp. M08fum]|uniref:Sigma-54-dependent Fis family transcriptional regulator n=1 Tax=Pelovirga terrestris TaxID=2771352 RepID=A0A8J6URL9_9BACT|nr:sigma-54-dependent Fis family transcriptional regulator [Pelovirga terrestris]
MEKSCPPLRIGSHVMATNDDYCGMIGNSPQMLELFDLIACVAEEGSSTVLIQGESGTGKELIARAVHDNSPRRTGHFVPVNCAAIPDELLESELFGYVKGAFTGAMQSKIGRIQHADGGTLFLDEIGDMKSTLQAKLLRVLQEREVEQVGGVRPTKVDVRVIAATHQNLDHLVASGRFREDLYYRLAVIPIIAPPLRERRSDITLLIERFIDRFTRRKTDRRTMLDPQALQSLMAFDWPGNVRELENLIQRLVILHRGKRISMKELPEKYRCEHVVANGADAGCAGPGGEISTVAAHPQSTAPGIQWGDEGIDFNMLISDFEDRLILEAISRSGGNKKEAARLLNLKRTTLIEKIKKKNLPV